MNLFRYFVRPTALENHKDLYPLGVKVFGESWFFCVYSMYLSYSVSNAQHIKYLYCNALYYHYHYYITIASACICVCVVYWYFFCLPSDKSLILKLNSCATSNAVSERQRPRSKFKQPQCQSPAALLTYSWTKPRSLRNAYKSSIIFVI